MDSGFGTYFQLGMDHILDVDAYDHILFIVALCAIFTVQQWKRVLILVTAFTIGHCITLVLAGLKIIGFPSDVIEFLIPLTILITAISNARSKLILAPDQNLWSTKFITHYLTALFFGLIHGMGFSNFFAAMLGEQGNLVKPLFGFNVGIEVGQLIIVALIMTSSYIALNVLNISQKSYKNFVLGAAAGIAAVLLKEAVFW